MELNLMFGSSRRHMLACHDDPWPNKQTDQSVSWNTLTHGLMFYIGPIKHLSFRYSNDIIQDFTLIFWCQRNKIPRHAIIATCYDRENNIWLGL